jgi:hypothetical protein
MWSHRLACTHCADAFKGEVPRFERELHCGVGLLDEGPDHLDRQLGDSAAITTDHKEPVIAAEPDE